MSGTAVIYDRPRRVRTGRRTCVRRRDLDADMIFFRNDSQATFVRSASRRHVRCGIEPWGPDMAGMPPQFEAARPIATTPVTATPTQIPSPAERARTGELVPTGASDDAKEVTP